VQRLCALIRLRNSHPAFSGQFMLGESKDAELDLRWNAADEFARLHVDFATRDYSLEYSDDGSIREFAISDN
jgi:sucrose phosphorylase